MTAGQAVHRPRRHRRLLRRRRGPPQSVAPGQARSSSAACPTSAAWPRPAPTRRASYGVHSGMSLRNAYKLCPQGVFVRGNYQVYQSFSDRFFRILHDYTPGRRGGLDRRGLSRPDPLPPSLSFVLRGRPRRSRPASSARPGSRSRSASAPNKILAKLATRRAKPAGYFEIEPGRRGGLPPRPRHRQACPASAPRPRSSSACSTSRRSATCGACRGRRSIRSSAWAATTSISSRAGSTAGPWSADGVPKSVSRETTFLEDLWDRRLLLAHLAYLCDRLTLGPAPGPLLRPRHRGQGALFRLRTEVRRRLLLTPRQEMGDIYKIAEELFLPLFAGSRLALRLVGVKASDLTRARPLSLFEPYSDREERLGAAVDRVREKYGFGSVLTIREKMLDAVYPFDREPRLRPQDGLAHEIRRDDAHSAPRPFRLQPGEGRGDARRAGLVGRPEEDSGRGPLRHRQRSTAGPSGSGRRRPAGFVPLFGCEVGRSAASRFLVSGQEPRRATET